jgi:Rer1 family
MAHRLSRSSANFHIETSSQRWALLFPSPIPRMLSNFFFPYVPVKRAIQYWLDKSTIHVVPRWLGFVALLLLFFLRIYMVQGYFIVAYGLGIFLLNNFIAFLSPLEDPQADTPGLPTTAKEGKEFRPFARRLPEFKFWLACFRGTFTSICMTFFSVFDIPVFWPILLMYFFVLFFMTMKRQIMHMYKHKYVPISFGKSKYKTAGVEQGPYGGGMSKDR